MTRAEVVARARSAVGSHTIYALGAGGMKPAAARPWNDVRGCDCSGFAMWALGLPRFDGKKWWDTSAIAHDAMNAHELFTAQPWAHAQPGDLFVYGDSGGHQGHVGVIATVTLIPVTVPLSVVHCSLGGWRHFGDAIRETAPDIWQHHEGALVARCKFIHEALA